MSTRTRRASRPVSLALVAGALSLGCAQLAAPAGAAPADVASCRAAGGVYIYTGSSGNGACSHQLSTSLDALRSVASVDFDNSGIICRIDAQPASCPAKADANNFWHYWWWTGHGWVFATLGPASHQPSAGSVEAWTFGGDTRPSWTPPAAIAPASTTRRAAAPGPTSHATHTHEPAAPVSGVPAPSASATTLHPGQHPTQRSTNQQGTGHPQGTGAPAATQPAHRTPAAGGSGSAATGGTANTRTSGSASAQTSPSASTTPGPSSVPASAPASQHSRPSGLLYGIILLAACAVGIVVSARRRRR